MKANTVVRGLDGTKYLSLDEKWFRFYHDDDAIWLIYNLTHYNINGSSATQRSKPLWTREEAEMYFNALPQMDLIEALDKELYMDGTNDTATLINMITKSKLINSDVPFDISAYWPINVEAQVSPVPKP